jgi:hypothetical protein
MKKSAKKTIIFVILILELAWFFCPRFSMHGRVLDEAYRNAERKTALYAWVEHRTPETKAAYDEEVKLLDRHMEMGALTILAAGLVINAAGIYLFWRYAPTKTTA